MPNATSCSMLCLRPTASLRCHSLATVAPDLHRYHCRSRCPVRHHRRQIPPCISPTRIPPFPPLPPPSAISAITSRHCRCRHFLHCHYCLFPRYPPTLPLPCVLHSLPFNAITTVTNLPCHHRLPPWPHTAMSGVTIISAYYKS